MQQLRLTTWTGFVNFDRMKWLLDSLIDCTFILSLNILVLIAKEKEKKDLWMFPLNGRQYFVSLKDCFPEQVIIHHRWRFWAWLKVVDALILLKIFLDLSKTSPYMIFVKYFEQFSLLPTQLKFMHFKNINSNKLYKMKVKIFDYSPTE